jgi:hypothetical protein
MSYVFHVPVFADIKWSESYNILLGKFVYEHQTDTRTFEQTDRWQPSYKIINEGNGMFLKYPHDFP